MHSQRLRTHGEDPVRSAFLVFGRPQIGEEEIAEVVDTLRSGWIGFGPKALRFEEAFAQYVGAKHALSVNSATAALHLSLIAAGVGQGDEVITTPLTFCATANVILHVGAKPVFVDVVGQTQNIDPARIEDAITPRTRAILPVHMAGWPCEMDAIQAIADRHGLTVIEDAAHAIEARYRGRKVGSISRFTAFSFYATKNLTTGEGGMLTTDDEVAHRRLKSLRLHGLDKDAWKRYAPGEFTPYETIEPGYKYNLTDLQASLGLHQLARIERSLEARGRIWKIYDWAFADIAGIHVPYVPVQEGSRHARHLYTLQVEPSELGIDRNAFVGALAAENIGAGVHFVPVHLHRYYRETFGYQRGDFPIAEAIGDRTVSLPLSPAMNDEDASDVATAVIRVVRRCGSGQSTWLGTEEFDEVELRQAS